MSLYLDSNFIIGAHVSGKFCYLICLRHLIRAVTNIFFSFPIFIHACATCSELLSNILYTISNVGKICLPDFVLTCSSSLVQHSTVRGKGK